MKPFLEHLNMTSTDVDETVRFLLTAMPEFGIRGGGGGEEGCLGHTGARRQGAHDTDAKYL